MNIDLIIVPTGHYNHSLPPSARVVSRFHVKRNKLVATHQHTAILTNRELYTYIHYMGIWCVYEWEEAAKYGLAYISSLDRLHGERCSHPEQHVRTTYSWGLNS